ncbi:DUF5947 family protein [Pseudonocardia sp. DLS-67]
MTALGSLRRLLAEPDTTVPVPEVCELCATPVPAEHPHLVQVEQRRLLCACGPCAFLFDNPGAGAGEYRRVPDRYLSDPGFRLGDARWDALQIPVSIAFFLRNSARDAIVACYPGPAGATESELGLDAWESGVGTSRLAAALTPDVEALLVRHGRDHDECLLVPVDTCYRLVGLVRRHWKGFDGGTEAWQEIDAFFEDLRDAARPVTELPSGGA